MLALALLLDAVLGEPAWAWWRVPHPAVLLGRLVARLESVLNRGPNRRARGVLALMVLVGAALTVSLLIGLLPFARVFETLAAAILLAHRSLTQHVTAVARGLEVSLAEGRARVAMIVGRDAETLDQHGTARAAIESAAENFSDGVLAPAFWFAVAGLPGIALYKAVNTADSMIGYRNDRYRDFGWASARLDDWLNWIPARLCGLLFCLVGSGRAAWDIMLRDARLHASPNAGWPEAAAAASLGVALAGPRIYDGKRTDDPFVNPQGRADAAPADIDAAVRLLWMAWAVLFALACAGAALRSW